MSRAFNALATKGLRLTVTWPDLTFLLSSSIYYCAEKYFLSLQLFDKWCSFLLRAEQKSIVGKIEFMNFPPPLWIEDWTIFVILSVWKENVDVQNCRQLVVYWRFRDKFNRQQENRGNLTFQKSTTCHVTYSSLNVTFQYPSRFYSLETCTNLAFSDLFVFLEKPKLRRKAERFQGKESASKLCKILHTN